MNMFSMIVLFLKLVVKIKFVLPNHLLVFNRFFINISLLRRFSDLRQREKQNIN